MSVAEKSALTGIWDILSGFPLINPIGVALSTIIMLVSMYILQPVHSSVLPSLLLIVTLFCLSLNVASTPSKTHPKVVEELVPKETPGPTLNELVRTGKSFSCCTDGRRVPDDLHAFPRERLIDLLFNLSDNVIKG